MAEQCTVISIVGDSVLETSEAFTVELSTSDVDVLLDPDLASVMIVDNDSEFCLANYS